METQFSCELRLRGGPCSKNSSTKPALFGGIGLFGQNSDETSKSPFDLGDNLFSRRKGRPLWS